MAVTMSGDSEGSCYSQVNRAPALHSEATPQHYSKVARAQHHHKEPSLVAGAMRLFDIHHSQRIATMCLPQVLTLGVREA